MDKITIVVQDEEAGKRLDSFLAQACGVSRNLAQQYIEAQLVRHLDRPVTKSLRLTGGMQLEITLPDEQENKIIPEEIPLDIVYEDEYLLVVDKKKGMVVHPAAGIYKGTLVNALLWHCGDHLSHMGGEERPGIVHRIDKDTSGLLVVAKDDETHQDLASQFALHTTHRMYQAVVYGGFADDYGRIEAPIGRNSGDRKKMAVNKQHGKAAATEYWVLARYDGFSYIKLKLETGRTHQIRVHMAFIGHPVAGDPIYGPRKVIHSLQGQCLHAGELGFKHPKTGEYLAFESPLPDVFRQFLDKLERKTGI